MLFRFLSSIPVAVYSVWAVLLQATSPDASSTKSALQQTAPGPRLGHSLVFDTHLRAVLLVDGSWPQASSSAGALWSWKGARWQLLSDSGPPSTSMGAAIYDVARQRVLVYGGSDRGTARGHVWEGMQNGGLVADTSPGARFHHAMAYDSARAVTVMYGGAARGRWDADTWVWDGTRWTRHAVPGPGPRAAFRMVYDSRRRQVVLFGGIGPPGSDGQQQYLNDTWVWEGAAWRKVGDGGPSARRDHTMSFDRREGVVLLYGGASGSGAATQRFRDMWKWDGSRWSEISLAPPNPGHRYLSAMTYDAARDRTVLYGGYTCRTDNETCGVADDTWEWDGRQWLRSGEPPL